MILGASDLCRDMRYVWLSAMTICMGMFLGDHQDLETIISRNKIYIYIADIYVDIQYTN